MFEFETELGVLVSVKLDAIIQCTYNPSTDISFFAVEPGSVYKVEGRDAYERFIEAKEGN